MTLKQLIDDVLKENPQAEASWGDGSPWVNLATFIEHEVDPDALKWEAQMYPLLMGGPIHESKEVWLVQVEPPYQDEQEPPGGDNGVEGFFVAV